MNDPATDSEMRALAEQERADLKAELETLEHELKLKLLPKDTADSSSAIVEIRAGTGGDEAALFAGDLLRMYQRYCAASRLEDRIDVAFRKRSRRLSRMRPWKWMARGVYAKLKFESGVHRVQRVPVTGSKRAHPHLGGHGCGSA